MAAIGSSRASTRLGSQRRCNGSAASDADDTTPSSPPTPIYLNPSHLRHLPPSVPDRKIHATRLPARPTFCQADLLPRRILAATAALHSTAAAAVRTMPANALLSPEPSKDPHSQGPRTLAMPPFCHTAFLPRRRSVAPSSNRSSRTRAQRVAPTVPSIPNRLMPRPAAP